MAIELRWSYPRPYAEEHCEGWHEGSNQELYSRTGIDGHKRPLLGIAMPWLPPVCLYQLKSALKLLERLDKYDQLWELATTTSISVYITFNSLLFLYIAVE